MFMKRLLNIFVVIHIRLDDIKVGKYKLRQIITLMLAILLLISMIVFINNVSYKPELKDYNAFKHIWLVIKSGSVMMLLVIITFYWLTSWFKASKAVEKVGKNIISVNNGNSDPTENTNIFTSHMQDKSLDKYNHHNVYKKDKYKSSFNVTNKYYENINKAVSNSKDGDLPTNLSDEVTEIIDKRDSNKQEKLKKKKKD